MLGHRAIVGLSLLCALFFCALATQSASAAFKKSEKTTAFTCVKTKPNSGDFNDEHCDEFVGANKGEYTHVEIAKNTTTEITATNSTTGAGTFSPTLKGKLGGVELEIVCKTGHAEGFIHNVEPSANIHEVTGTATTKFGGAAGSKDCTVVKPANCTVKEPIEVKAEFEGVEGGGAGNNEMGLEFKVVGGKAGGTFVEITLEGAKCAIKVPLVVKLKEKVTGVIATGTPKPTEKYSGATLWFTNAMTAEALEIGGNVAEFEAKFTPRMKRTKEEEEKKEDKTNPIALTTTP
jgi:hypothetical protein